MRKPVYKLFEPPRGRAARRGAIVPLAALLMVALVGMVAFAVDIGWMTVTKSELQNAADSAALAGVQPLMDAYVQYNLPLQLNKNTILNNALASARAKAKEYAGYNGAGGLSSLTLKDSDIEFGFLDDKNVYTPMPVYSGFPNTIKVVLRRDGTANGSLDLFFGRVFGAAKSDLTATASATMYGGAVNTFVVGNTNAGILPMTYDVDHWDNWVKTGLDPDGLSSVDSLGNPQLKVYPSIKAPGNFGQISLNDSHTGASTTSSWIHNGVPPSDIQMLIDHNLIPLSAHDPTLWDWQGNTGFKASTVMDVNQHEGSIYLIPLFKAKDPSPVTYQAGVGQGSNYFYNVVRFVPVRIMYTSDRNREIIVQPAPLIEPTAVLGTPAPVGSTPASSTSSVVFSTARLTR